MHHCIHFSISSAWGRTDWAILDGKQKSFTSGSIRYSSTSSSHQLARESRDDVAAISSCFRRPKTAVCSLFIVKGYLNRFESGLIQNKRFEMHEEDLKKKTSTKGIGARIVRN